MGWPRTDVRRQVRVGNMQDMSKLVLADAYVYYIHLSIHISSRE